MILLFLFDFCSMHPLLWALLPFLLGLALGYALWAKYKSMVTDLESQASSLKGRLAGLEGDVKGHLHHIAELEGDVSLAKGKMREAEDALANCEKRNKDLGSNKGSTTIAASTASIASSLAVAGSGVIAGSGKKSKYAALKTSNLQLIEGIGPKMEEVLQENGVNTWSDLAAKSESELRELLDNYGDKYKIIDVTSWQSQAKLAADNDFDGLIALQKNLAGGSQNTLGSNDSKLEKYLIKTGAIKQFKLNDLKAVEGIGPKIEELLNKAGINTWSELAQTSADKIHSILNEAGSRFKLADPNTWPKQAEMAANGKWDDLAEYQDFLQGGKE